MPSRPLFRRFAALKSAACWRVCLAALLLGPVLAQSEPLPPEVDAALRRAKLPASALAVVVQEAGTGQRKLAWNDADPVNPASVFKLFTTYAALDQLGPAWTWTTPVYLNGPLRDGVLDGSVAVRGSGDPKLVVERIWLMLRKLQQLGVKDIRGDILLDRGAFQVPESSPAEFDGDPTRPYNVRPDALLLNLKSVIFTFTPDAAHGVAIVAAEPALAGLQVDASVPLNGGACDDWRSALKAQVGDPNRVRFGGSFPAACGEKGWPVAYADARSYNARMIEQLWREMGGRLGGAVRDGAVPAGARLAFDNASPPLAEVVRDINKYSNNVMAEQLFWSLPAATRAGAGNGPVRAEDAREALRRWVQERFGDAAAKETVIDNGSGLSRETRVSVALLARLLQNAWGGPVMSELMSSLPVSGLDGTLKRSKAEPGRAHLKTGSLRDVAAVAGYVLSNSGKRYVLVAVLNHPNANAGRPALDALVQWAIRDAPQK
jgi:D-alanyl-D-alanine carboxypeptidase/D-alanyl-D-alanine-endopeptidase (penicillin-binding protein 4)